MPESNNVRGPVYIAATPLMVTADVEPLVHANVTELLDLLSGEFFEDFITATSEESSGHDGHAPEALRFERLAELLVERMSTRVSMTGRQAVRVAGQLHKLGLPLAEAEEEKKAALAKATGVSTAEVEQALGASEIKHPSMRATRRHLKANPFPKQDRHQDGAA
ncbi:hypothetical protein ACJWDR_29150 [Streptomyces tauricus]|uniref:hypothetical protein n=1 Tax=Streptomyces tauricus TaxID=68274 RepID=UPI00387EE8C0